MSPVDVPYCEQRLAELHLVSTGARHDGQADDHMEPVPPALRSLAAHVS
jgi:hypothetical protein